MNSTQKSAAMTVLISAEIDLKTKITRDKGHFIMIKRSIHQEDTIPINTQLGEAQNTYGKTDN